MSPKFIIIYLFTALVFTSCIKDDEPLNREADIENFLFSQDIMVNSNVKDESVTIFVKPNTNLSSLIPEIKITSGATIEPKSGVPQNFNDTVYYTVTSEDGNWQKKYYVTVDYSLFQDTIRYDFEEWVEEGQSIKYPMLKDNLWSNANSGIAIALSGNVPRYPTSSSSTSEAYKGSHAAYLQTQKGKKVFGFFLVPVFAGSMFRGKFQLKGGDFLASAMFGQAHPKEAGKPVHFKGYYKYQPGSVYYDENDNIIAGKIDECSIYAIMYKVTKGSIGTPNDEFLDGSNVMSSDKAIAKAILQDRSAKSEYTEFSIPLTYSEEPDYDRYDYKLAIVFSSSVEGDFYRGAVGSTLIVDEVSVACEAYEDED